MVKKFFVGIIILVIAGNLMPAKDMDQAIKELEGKIKTVSPEGKVEVLNQLSLLVRDISAEKSLRYGSQALELARKRGDKRGEAAALRNTGVAYQLSGDIARALDYLKEAAALFKTLNDKENASESVKDIGAIYWEKGDYDSALKYFYEALALAKESGYKKGIGDCVANIGIVYLRLGDLDRALKHLSEGLEIDKQLKDKRGMSISFNNIALVYHKKKNRERALEYYLKSAKIAEELGSTAVASLAYMHMGILYEHLENPKKSVNYFYKAYQLAEKTGQKRLVATTANNLAAYYVEREEYDEALAYAQKGRPYAEEVEDKHLLKDVYINFSYIYSGKKEYKKALEYCRLAFEINDKIYTEESSKQIAEMQTRYETLEKEKKIAILEKNEEIQQIKLSKERLAKNALIGGLVLVLALLMLLFKKYLYLFAFWKREKYIGQFRLQEQIGTGGMGVIYRAHDIRDKSHSVAVKILKEDLFLDENNIKRFKQEAAIIDKLDHPHIVKIIERGEYKGKHFIVTEYLKGKTLDVKIDEESPLHLRESLFIMEQISDALALIHSKHIIHRDIKPANIMLIEKEGDPHFVKLMDFGLARAEYQTRLTRTGIMVGTINYMSPELLDRNEYSLDSDVYSLGVTFYEMVTAKKPFLAETPTDIMKQILHTVPPEPNRYRSDIPTELNRLIMAMLNKDPQHRPPLKEILETLKKIQSTH
jgi:tetratricopeptide (TPR) repeat protein